MAPNLAVPDHAAPTEAGDTVLIEAFVPLPATRALDILKVLHRHTGVPALALPAALPLML